MKIKSNILKTFVLITIAINFVLSVGFLNIDIKLDIQKEHEISSSTREILNKLISNNYIVINNKNEDFLLLNNQNNEDVFIRVYVYAINRR